VEPRAVEGDFFTIKDSLCLEIIETTTQEVIVALAHKKEFSCEGFYRIAEPAAPVEFPDSETGVEVGCLEARTDDSWCDKGENVGLG